MRKASPPLLHRLAAVATFILIYKPNVSVIAPAVSRVEATVVHKGALLGTAAPAARILGKDDKPYVCDGLSALILIRGRRDLFDNAVPPTAAKRKRRLLDGDCFGDRGQLLFPR